MKPAKGVQELGPCTNEYRQSRNALPDAYRRMPLNREDSFVDEVWSLRGYMNPKYMITMAGDLLLP
ncbi:hypothetical protein Cs7R123_63640 [Catellatospora sp. TT07R-123]|nr:hypothetical protein Cs7R123_63640 [Catellatospora sp. TT07R-123]